MALNMNRDDGLQSFICALEAGIRSRITDYADATPIVDQIFATLNHTDGIQGNKKPTRLPVCDHLDNAFSQARKGPKTIYELTNSLTNIEQNLEWYRRPEAHKHSADFFNGHANAVIVGEGGWETQQDVRIGVSLVAPRIDYPR
ncbi:MAG: dimethylsulfoniopropionate lyase, partial [Alphaproteobacteria bacterium]|nr:dimethylsulfoniopropionate lyase [Alphaproteobacteria bacterium]